MLGLKLIVNDAPPSNHPHIPSILVIRPHLPSPPSIHPHPHPHPCTRTRTRTRTHTHTPCTPPSFHVTHMGEALAKTMAALFIYAFHSSRGREHVRRLLLFLQPLLLWLLLFLQPLLLLLLLLWLLLPWLLPRLLLLLQSFLAQPLQLLLLLLQLSLSHGRFPLLLL